MIPSFSRTVRWALAICLLVVRPGRADDRYLAWLADGTKLTANALGAWPIPGLSYRLDNRELLAAENPVRFVRDRRASCVRQPPFVELANGDVLAGSPVQLEAGDGRAGRALAVRVQLEAPLLALSGSGASVRTDRIARIVRNVAGRRAGSDFASQPPPGTVVLADGRRLVARSIRWREYGLAFLTNDGVVEAQFGELADVVFPHVDQAAAVIEDGLVASSSGGAVARFGVSGGSIVTAARVTREQEQSRRRGRLVSAAYYYLQPAWAEQPVAIPEQELAWCGYRGAREVPLSLLAARELANRRIIGPVEPWLLNQSANGSLLGLGRRESDLGISAHAHSEIAFALPAGAKTLELAVGLDRAVGGGGCVRCKVIGEGTGEGGQGTGGASSEFKVQGSKLAGSALTTTHHSPLTQHSVLWDSGVIQGSDGLKSTGKLEVSGLAGVVLVTEYAAAERPAGADPLDIRDQVVWLAPLVELEASAAYEASRVQAALAGVQDWELASGMWEKAEFAQRWNLLASGWDAVVSIPAGGELVLSRKVRVEVGADVLELLTSCPADLTEHDFSLTVDGTPVTFANNTDRQQLRQWVQRYGRLRARDEEDDARITDRLAYWWDLSPWRGREVELQLALKGRARKSEVAWRGLSIRSAIGNLPGGSEPRKPDVLLTALVPLETPGGRSQPVKDALPPSREGEPIRFLGQPFTGGYGFPRNSVIRLALQAEYAQFVCVVGCSWQTAGPVRVLIDERVAWERASIQSLLPAEQLEIAIPAGAKTLTLESGDGNHYGIAAFANAGFVVK